VDDPEAIERFEKGWNAKMPSTKGLDNHYMIEAIQQSKLKAMWVTGEDTITSDANMFVTEEALSKLQLFIVQDLVFTKTCRHADVVFPACSSLEKEGTFTNTERRIQRLYQVMEPLGESRPDWQIFQDVANRMGAGWKYTHPSDVMDEAAKLCPIFAGVSYDRLEGYKSLQWPVATDGTDQPLLFTEGFPFPDGKAKFHPLEWIAPCEEVDEEFDLHLDNGRVLEHFEVGNMTYLSKGITEYLPDTFIEVSPELAAERGIETGRFLELRSRHGWLKARALVTDRVNGKLLYMGMNTIEYPVNRLSGSDTDRATDTPAYKEIAVKMKVLPEKGDSPVPRSNFRFGRRTPQHGVEVERKWMRPDYRPPGSDLVQISTKSQSRRG
jgi:formate dehydrogenase major subunit